MAGQSIFDLLSKSAKTPTNFFPGVSAGNSAPSTSAPTNFFPDANSSPAPVATTSTGMPQPQQPHNSWWRSGLSNLENFVRQPVKDVTPALQSFANAHPQTANAVLDSLSKFTNTMSGIGNIIPNQIGDWANSISQGKPSWKDIPLADSAVNFGKGFADAPLNTNPILHGLQNMGKNSQDFGQLFNQAGWKYNAQNPWYTPHNLARGGASFAADTATDPLTLLTGGATDLGKISSDAMASAARDVAKGAGVDVGKGAAGDVASGTAKNIMDKAIANGMPEKQAKVLHDTAFNDIINAGKAARAKAQNSLVNLDIPFTNKTASLIQKPGFLQPTEQAIQDHAVQAVKDAFDSRGFSPAAQEKALKNIYGKSAPENLTPQEFQNLQSRLSTFPVIKNAEKPTGVPAFDNLSQLPEQPTSLSDLLSPKPAELPKPEPVQPDLSQLMNQPFVPEQGGQSILGELRDKVFGRMNPRKGEGANTVWDTQNRISGEQFDMNQQRKLLNKEAKQLTPAEQSLVHFMVEKKMPEEKYLTQAEKTALQKKDRVELMQSVADHIREINKEQIMKPELHAGTLNPDLVRENYAYHMLNPNSGLTEEQMKAMSENPYQNISTLNKSNQERKGFQTFADQRNAIGQLQDALQHVTDPAEKAKIEDRITALQNLYEKNPMTALTKRWSNSIRTRNYKQMFNELKMQGLVRDSHDMPAELAQNFDKLALKDERNFAKKAGLPAGSYVHKDVLNGLKRVDKLFNPNDFGKWLGNINAVSNIWKTLPIIYNPAHLHVRLIGDVSNAMLAGATMKDILRGAKLTKDAYNGKLTEAEQKLYDTVINEGILRDHAGQNEMAHQRFTSSTASKKLQKAEDFMYNNPVGKKMGGALNYMDNQARLAVFLAGMRKTGDPKFAANLVRKFMFNYNELSGADKAIQTVVPFWVWTRNNLPLMVEQLAKQPRYFEAFNRFQAQTQGNHPTYPWAQDFLHLKGNYFENLRLPMSDLNAFDQPGNEAINMLSPINPLVLLGEQQANKDYFTGMPIDKYSATGKASTKSMLGYTAQQATSGLLANIMRDQGNGHSAEYNLFNGLIGGLSEQNPAKIAKEQNWQRAQDLKMQRKKAQAKAKA